MRNFTFAPIIVLIIFILIPLARYVLNRMQRHFEPSKLRQPMPDMGMRRQATPPISDPRPVVTRERPQAPPSMLAIGSSRRRWSKGMLFRTRSDVRRTIVAMTILGPCRAYDPPG